MATIGMFNEEGENVDLYIPRKCHATNTLIEAHDHAAVQISIANVGPNGVINGTTTTLCIAGYLRSQGERVGGGGVGACRGTYANRSNKTCARPAVKVRSSA
ncbi:Ribosomal protein S21e family protein [Leishmania donovani]|uniref:Ribosomal protein S21e family protein n=1 Tax=Leishmania donovani TaxID=5661 RepID=A0A504XVI4_LEIDO|nr:Ribosomal protein S21e family protein [Leishmania donovani]TPP53022.1 Ribosomal protein S21e family protein [Leishmania donovani]